MDLKLVQINTHTQKEEKAVLSIPANDAQK